MPKLTIQISSDTSVTNADAQPTSTDYAVAVSTRLINAISDTGIDQLHSCGGQGRCTTCRVQFISGEPKTMTQVEHDLLLAKGIADQPGVRLSCQIACDHDMAITVISRLKGSTKKDCGPRPKDEIEPAPVWISR